MVPWWASTRALAMESPRPSPVSPVDRKIALLEAMKQARQRLFGHSDPVVRNRDC
jgi:hypothetical protein